MNTGLDGTIDTLRRRWGCRCGCGFSPARRRFGAALLGAGALVAMPAWADGIQIGERSQLAQLVPAEEIEQAAAQQYHQMLQEAAKHDALAPPDHPQVVRLRYIAQRLIPFVESPNLNSTRRAAHWKWEVNLIGSKEINAFCMPGGKIAFFWGILDRLQLSDDEVAMVMGHEIAHALREHAREQMGKSAATRGIIDLGAALLGLGSGGHALASLGGQLLSLRFGRQDESEADLIGMDLAARAGYDPRAAITLWQKMGKASQGAPPEWLSTHPADSSRIRDLEAALPKVAPVYARAPKPSRNFGPPPRAAAEPRGRRAPTEKRQ